MDRDRLGPVLSALGWHFDSRLAAAVLRSIRKASCVAILLTVYVDPEYRKRGLAHELVERSMAEARAGD